MDRRILLASPTMHEEEIEYINEAFLKNWVAPLGFNCDSFEFEMMEYLNHKSENTVHALCVTSGTAALHLALVLAGVKKGDTVFCSDFTFIASANPALYQGANLVFIDSETKTWGLDPNALEKAFEKYPDTRVVIATHLYGTPFMVDEILDICKKNKAILIEDAAESLSSIYKEHKTGTFGEYASLSFNGNKIITTSGGGMLVTQKKVSRDRAFFLATQAKEPTLFYEHKEIGYNYRMSNIIAGIGRGQLLHLKEHRTRKEQIYNRYKEAFNDYPVTMNPYDEKNSFPNFWLSSIVIDKNCCVSPQFIAGALNDNNVDSRPMWMPMHMQPIFKDNDFICIDKYSVSEDVFKRGLCLPSDIKMTDEEQDYVIDIIKGCFK